MARARSHPPITPALLLRAYSIGLFPMAESADDDALFWVDPEQRGIFPFENLRIPRSLAKTLRSDLYTIRTDRDFDGVIAACAEARPGRTTTWINGRIRSLFGALHRMGHVHTVEAYRGEELVGGLYGLHIGGAFFGESMFHRATDASKVCLAHLAARLVAGGFSLLDTQFITPHLASLGAMEVPRATYHALLEAAVVREAHFDPPEAPVDGASVLRLLERARDA